MALPVDASVGTASNKNSDCRHDQGWIFLQDLRDYLIDNLDKFRQSSPGNKLWSGKHHLIFLDRLSTIVLRNVICPKPDTGTTLLMFNIVYAKTHVQLNTHSIPKLKIEKYNMIENNYGCQINIFRLWNNQNAINCHIFKILYHPLF